MAKKGTGRDLALRDAELDEQIARMREMLRLMSPESGSSALGAIRQAFPEVPLAARVSALNDYRRQEPDGGVELSSAATGLRSASA